MNDTLKVLNSYGKVLVVGDIMLDKYVYCKVERISPEAPVPVLNQNSIEYRVGGAGNVALNLSQLSTETSILSLTGEDSNSKQINKLLTDNSVETHIIEIPSKPTITKTRYISNQQQLFRFDEESKFSEEHSKILLEKFKTIINDFEVVVFSDYGKGTLDLIKEFISISKSKKIKILVDPKGDDYSIYSGAYLITPNSLEFKTAIGEFKDFNNLKDKSLEAINTLKINNILVTRGKEGMALFSKNNNHINLPALAKEVYDVTGAGDTVIATIAKCLSVGINIQESIRFSNVAASIVVSKFGTATVNSKELIEALRDHSETRQEKNQSDKIIKSYSSLQSISVELKEKGKRIVATNGCFDILHPGHLKLLRDSSELGDVLVVLINTDDSIKKLKGGNRPINDLNFRIEMLCHYNFIDYIFPFENETPLEAIECLKPEILVKGGDYKKNEVVGGREIEKYGGAVKIIQLIDGYSSSSIIDKIKKT